MTRNSRRISDGRIRKNILKEEGEWISQRLQSFSLSLSFFYLCGFVSIKTNGIDGLEVQLAGLKTKFQKEVLLPWTYDFSICEIFESIREKRVRYQTGLE